MHSIFKKMSLCAFNVQTAYRRIVTLVWLACNIVIFAHQFWLYAGTDEYLYLRHVTKLGLAFSRASAGVILFNSVLLVLLVCRNLVSAVKGIPFMPKPIVQTLDAATTYHRILAITICASTVVHVIGHISNCTHIIMACVTTDPTTQRLVSLIFADMGLPMNQNATHHGIMENLRQVAQTRSIVTGIVLCIILACIMFTARQSFRRVRFNVFWYLHKVFFISYFVLLCVHAMGLLKYQSNLHLHNPATCITTLVQSNNATHNATAAACSVSPQFKSIPPGAWKWVCAPLVIYLVEKCVRLWRHFQRCTVTKIDRHSEDVLELQLQRKGFSYGLGEYVFLFCPQISLLEWHPFSLTSHPQEGSFSVHIRLLGDWTKKLDDLCEAGNYDAETCQLKIVCDGPYKSPASNITRYNTIVCIGSNIGITPFVAVLKSFLCRESGEDVKPSKHPKKVYFYWMCRSRESFEWLKDLLQKVEQDLAERGDGDSIEYNLHLTKKMGLKSMKSVANRYDSVKDHITGLQNKTHFGRPRWGHVFEEMLAVQKGKDIGVFVCGAQALSNDLNKCCQKYSDGETNFFLHPESFG